MLGGIVAQQPGTIAIKQGAGCKHFGVKDRAPRELSMEEPAMPVGPFHHGCNAEPICIESFDVFSILLDFCRFHRCFFYG